MFYIISNIFSLIFNEVLISLHSCLDSTHTNYLALHPTIRYLNATLTTPSITAGTGARSPQFDSAHHLRPIKMVP
jgi:hypothetical protein